jgi:hypothetical protein
MDSVDTLIVGGSETTATALSGATYLLATNPDVFKKLAEEVRSRFKNEDEIDLISVQKLEYMMAVIHEALRVYPPVPAAMPRKVLSESFLTPRGEFIPPNVSILNPIEIILNYSNLSIRQLLMFGNGPCFITLTILSIRRLLFLKGGLVTHGLLLIKRKDFSPFQQVLVTVLAKSMLFSLFYSRYGAGTDFSLAYAELRLILARIIYNFDLVLDPRSENWTERNEIFLLWKKPDLYIRLTETGK